MRAVVQRVTWARVRSEGRTIGEIGRGLMVLVGVAPGDGEAEVEYLASKIRDLRIFDDGEGKLNLSVGDVGGEILIVSQFTLYGDCRRGRRPSFSEAAPPAVARPIYERLVERLRGVGLKVETGEFQALMHVELVNDGPVTLVMDTKG